MNKRYTVKNISLFVLTGLLIGWFVWWQCANEAPMISETLAMFLFAVSIIFKAYNIKIGQYAILILLIILLFNLITFSYTVVNGDVSTTYYSANFSSFGFNPIVFFVLISYIICNRRFVAYAYKLLIHGSVKEQKEKDNKDITFYYNMFNNCSGNELNDAFNLYNDYPLSAQKALNKIKAERNALIKN